MMKMNSKQISERYKTHGEIDTPETALLETDVVESPKKTALVFAGAGAKIIVEAGMAKAFVDSGLDYDWVFGTSSGSIISAALHADQIDEVIDFMMTVKNKDVYKWSPWKLWTKEACIFDNAPLKKTLARIINFDKVRAKTLQGKFCIANICDLANWEDVNVVLEPLHSNEQMIETIATSTCVPGAFPNHHNLVDGGVVDNYPLFDAIGKHVDRVIMFVTSTVDPQPINNIKDMISQTFALTFYNQLKVAMRSLELFKSETEVILIQVPESTKIGLLDFDGLGSKEQRKAHIQLGYDIASEALKNVKP